MAGMKNYFLFTILLIAIYTFAYLHIYKLFTILPIAIYTFTNFQTHKLSNSSHVSLEDVAGGEGECCGNHRQ